MKNVFIRKNRGVWLYLFLVLVVFSLTRIFFLETYRIAHSSMNNTLFDGDKVIVSKRSKITTNKVYVIEAPGGTYVKRCAGVPGDTIAIIKGDVFINNKLIVFPGTIIQPLVKSVAPGSDKSDTDDFDLQVTSLYNKNWTKDNFGPYVIPKDNYFFLGDNRPATDDSRTFGVIPKDKITGRVCMVLYSTYNWRRIFQQIQ
jgi:signal peptidase I